MQITTNDAYTQWKQNPSPENYDILAIAILKYATRLVKNKFAGDYLSTYEEGIGESLLQIYQNLHNFDPAKGSFGTWLYFIVRNTCYDITRHRKFRNYHNSSYELDQLYGKKDPDGVDGIRLSRLYENLNPDIELPLFKLKMEGFSDLEVAEKMGLPLGTIKSKFHHIKKKLKERNAPKSGGARANVK